MYVILFQLVGLPKSGGLVLGCIEADFARTFRALHVLHTLASLWYQNFSKISSTSLVVFLDFANCATFSAEFDAFRTEVDEHPPEFHETLRNAQFKNVAFTFFDIFRELLQSGFLTYVHFLRLLQSSPRKELPKKSYFKTKTHLG